MHLVARWIVLMVMLAIIFMNRLAIGYRLKFSEFCQSKEQLQRVISADAVCTRPVRMYATKE